MHDVERAGLKREIAGDGHRAGHSQRTGNEEAATVDDGRAHGPLVLAQLARREERLNGVQWESVPFWDRRLRFTHGNDTEDPDLYYRRGQVFAERRKFALATADFAQAIRGSIRMIPSCAKRCTRWRNAPPFS